MTTTRIAAIALTLLLPSTPALAFSLSYERPQRHTIPAPPVPGTSLDAPGARCAANPDAADDAGPPARPATPSGRIAGGDRC